MRRKTLINSTYSIFDYATNLIITLVTAKLLISYLGVDKYGIYALFVSLVATCELIDLGVGVAAAKYLSEYGALDSVDRRNETITYGILYYTFAGTTLFALVFIFADMIVVLLGLGGNYNESGRALLVVSSINAIANLYLNLGTSVLVALEKWRNITLFNFMIKLYGVLLTVLTIVGEGSDSYKIVYLFYIMVCCTCAKLMLYVYNMVKVYSDFKLKWPTCNTRNNMSVFVKWTSLQYFLSLSVGHFDKIIISKFFGLNTLGLYSFVTNVFVNIYGVLSSAQRIYYPEISRLHLMCNIDGLVRFFKRLIMFNLLWSFVIACFSVIFWFPVVSLYIDGKFAEETYAYFAVFAVYLVVRSPEVIFYYFFNAVAMPYVLVRNVAIGSSVTILCYLVFVPTINAYGLVLSQIMGSAATYFFVYRQHLRGGIHGLLSDSYRCDARV